MPPRIASACSASHAPDASDGAADAPHADGDAVAAEFRFVQMMRGQKHGVAVIPKAREISEESIAAGGIERCRGFVKKQERRIVGRVGSG